MSQDAPPPQEPGTRRVSADPFDAPDVEWRRISPKYALVQQLSLWMITVVLLIAPVVCWLIWHKWWLLLIIGVLVVGAVIESALLGRQVRAWAYAERREELLVRSGIMWRNIVVVPYGRLQYVDVEAGPLLRWQNLADVQLHTASAASDAKIPGLDAAEAARLRDRLTERGEARLAGL